MFCFCVTIDAIASGGSALKPVAAYAFVVLILDYCAGVCGHSRLESCDNVQTRLET